MAVTKGSFCGDTSASSRKNRSKRALILAKTCNFVCFSIQVISQYHVTAKSSHVFGARVQLHGDHKILSKLDQLCQINETKHQSLKTGNFIVNCTTQFEDHLLPRKNKIV